MSDESVRKRAMQELAEASEDLGLYDLSLTVCVTHQRFIPCRKLEAGCRFSSDAGDVAQVMRDQWGDSRADAWTAF
jgi:hypothetical protein